MAVLVICNSLYFRRIHGNLRRILVYAEVDDYAGAYRLVKAVDDIGTHHVEVGTQCRIKDFYMEYLITDVFLGSIASHSLPHHRLP